VKVPRVKAAVVVVARARVALAPTPAQELTRTED
jgi:hypothetical protein